MVRRMLDPDPATGQRRFTDRAFRYTGCQTSDLAYAVTGHSAQGATVYTGIALVTGTELSATEVRRRNLANADHLAVLHAIWTAETRDARHDRYRELVAAALPPGHRGALSHRARWLYRTLHTAELAGLNPAEVLRTAITARDLAGSRDIAAVIDARIRQCIDPLLPQLKGSWTSRIPQLPDPARQAYLTEIAVLMDDRTRRLGQHTARTASAWAVTALGPVPADPAARRDWERKAALIAAYREMYGYDHPGDPIGPEPSQQAPDQRAAWRQVRRSARHSKRCSAPRSETGRH